MQIADNILEIAGRHFQAPNAIPPGFWEITEIRKEYPFAVVLNCPEQNGKKYAIHAGVSNSSGCALIQNDLDMKFIQNNCKVGDVCRVL